MEPFRSIWLMVCFLDTKCLQEVMRSNSEGLRKVEEMCVVRVEHNNDDVRR